LNFDVRVLGYTLLLSLLTGVVFGLAPALQAARTDLVTELKERSSQPVRTRQRFQLRKLLVVAQVALSLVSLIGAGLFLRSLYNAQQIDPGFETEKLLVISFDVGSQGYDEARGQDFYRQVQERMSALPGVHSASIASNRPLAGGFMRSVTIEGRETPAGGRGILTLTNIAGPKYFETLGIPLRRGREFTEADGAKSSKVAVINEAMAGRFWPNEEAVGKRFKFFGEEAVLEIVGVVRDSDSVSLGEAARPLIYLPLLQNYTPTATLHVRTTGDPQAVLASVRREVQALDPNLPLIGATTVSEMIGRATWAARMGAALLCIFGLLALILTSIGIYGLLAYLVDQRRNEIGLRMALGAQRRDVLRMVMRQGLILVVVGTVIGLAAGFATTRLVTHLLYNVPGSDLVVTLSTTLLLAAVTLLATYIPARRATRIDPMAALRND
jgi:predicted permease